jgi:GT2 family glycosyltransferase
LLNISIVIYSLDNLVLPKTIESIVNSSRNLPSHLCIKKISLIDNGDNENELLSLIEQFSNSPFSIQYYATGKNLGYGQAHNIAIGNSTANYHLILNPDVIISPESLRNGLNYLEGNNEVVAVSPSATDGENNIQYLAKSYPSLLVLIVRALNLSYLEKLFEEKICNYELKELIHNKKTVEVKIISGCFMLCKTKALHMVGGFDSRYFLYFEDFSLSIELQKIGKIMHLPDMEIIHFGGNSSRKGINHICMFISSMIKFFNKYGWKIF